MVGDGGFFQVRGDEEHVCRNLCPQDAQELVEPVIARPLIEKGVKLAIQSLECREIVSLGGGYQLSLQCLETAHVPACQFRDRETDGQGLQSLPDSEQITRLVGA